MIRFRPLLACSLLFALSAGLPLFAQTPPQSPPVQVDDPEDEERFNEELWESIKHTPYEPVKERLARLHKSQRPNTPDMVLPNGWRLAPAGSGVEVGRFPYEAIAYAGKIVVLNTGYYTGKDKPEVSIVDPATQQVTQTLHFDSLFPSAQIGGDGDLYLSGGVSKEVYRVNARFETVRRYTFDGYTGGLASLDRNHLLVAQLVTAETPADFTRGKFGQGRLALLNTATGTIEREARTGYFPYAVSVVNGKIYVALQGEDKIQVFSPELQLQKTISVGRSPQAMTLSGERLYIVNANDDTVSVLDTRSDTIVRILSLRDSKTRFGGAPTSCVIEGERLYVTLANRNAVSVFDTRTGRHLGDIPTGWYPTKVLVNNGNLFILSAKGVRPRKPNPNGPQPVTGTRNGPDYVLTLLKGSLETLPLQSIDGKLKQWTQQVKEGSPLFSPAAGLKLPIRHIFYIVRENRTYDQVFGDIKGANGDPSLTLFGEDVTPNAHALAKQFVTLDNFYADGEISVLGHSFTTSGYASPFLEWLGNASYSGKWRGYPFGTVPAVMSPAYLWDALDARKVDYRIYGENYFLYTRGYKLMQEAFGEDSAMVQKFYAQMLNLASQTDRGKTFYGFASKYAGQAATPQAAMKLLDKPEFVKPLSAFLCGDQSLANVLAHKPDLKRKFAEYLYRYPLAYRSWDLSVSDLERVAVWKADFEQQLSRGKVAQLHYLWLPNDHTAGASTLPLPPVQFVAQNDAALGRIVETIANSPIWNQSLILVTEDDAQNGPDHVDATRTVGLAIGPYVKRGAVISDRYDQLSLLRTIEVILGLSPLHQGDRLAVPMLSVFTEKPDNSKPPMPQPSVHLAPADKLRFERLGDKN